MNSGSLLVGIFLHHKSHRYNYQEENTILPQLLIKGSRFNSIRHSMIQKGEKEQQNRPKIYFFFLLFLAHAKQLSRE